jgi:hypothetical protein
MYKTFSVVLTCALAMVAFACAGGAGNSTNSANTTAGNLDANHMPAGLSVSPLPVNGTTPGIPDANSVNINMSAKPGGTPTPGIPDPAHVVLTPNPKGTPTPGIPSQAEINKMLKQSAANNASVQNEANTPSKGEVRGTRDQMLQMKSKKKPQ